MPSKVKITFNNNVLLAQALKSTSVQRDVATRLNVKVEDAKQELLEEFNESNVTQEIEAGESLESSQILPQGYGNLFGFLGFEEGSDPVTAVREKLESIKLVKKPRTTTRQWIFKISAPSNEEIEEVSPMHWESGRSWVNAVTKGLSGFSHYLNSLTKKNGRSGAGIQTKSVLRSGEYFGGVPYLFGMLGRFRRKFTR